MPRLVPPFYLGPYKVVRQLGSGGFATVFRAAVEGDLGFSRDVALKVLHSHITRDSPEVVAMLADEARLMARMQHPNIVYVQWFGKLDHPEDGDVFAMMMEYVEGRTLGSMLHEARQTDTPLPLSVIVDVHIAVAKALAFAHSLKDELRQPMGLVHRDLKPENVMVSRQGAIKLLDFGIAKATDRLAEATATDLVRGTVHYMSPEQVHGTKDLDFRSDLFSLGGMLYESVLGSRLITADSIVAAIHQVAKFDPDPAVEALDGVNPALGAVARRLLAVDRDQRYSRTSDLVLEEARSSIQAAQTTETWLADRFMAVGDTHAIQTPSELRRHGDGVSETVDLRSGDSVPPTTVPPTRPQARVSGSRPPFSSSTNPRAAGDPLAPTAAIPSDQAILATLDRDLSEDEPKRRPAGLLWIALPAILAVGIGLGVFGPRLFRDQVEDPGMTTTEPATSGATESPAASAAPAADPVEQEEELVLAALEPEDEVERRDPEIEKAHEAEAPAKPPSGKGPDSEHARTATGATTAPTEADEAPAPPQAEPTPEITSVYPVPPETGWVRLAADHPFEVTIRGEVYSKLQARQGIELPAGSWPARFTCLQCPEGVATSLTVQVGVTSQDTVSRIVQFPAESR